MSWLLGFWLSRLLPWLCVWFLLVGMLSSHTILYDSGHAMLIVCWTCCMLVLYSHALLVLSWTFTCNYIHAMLVLFVEHFIYAITIKMKNAAMATFLAKFCCHGSVLSQRLKMLSRKKKLTIWMGKRCCGSEKHCRDNIFLCLKIMLVVWTYNGTTLVFSVTSGVPCGSTPPVFMLLVACHMRTCH